MTTVETDTFEAKRRKVHMLASGLRFSRGERLELAEIILRRDIRSWKDLDEAQYDRLLDAFEGWGVINHLLDVRQP